MKKLTALLLAIAMMVTCTLCAVAEDGKTYMAVCIASEPDTLDPALNSAVDGATMVAHLFAACPLGRRPKTASWKSCRTARWNCLIRWSMTTAR